MARWEAGWGPPIHNGRSGRKKLCGRVWLAAGRLLTPIPSPVLSPVLSCPQEVRDTGGRREPDNAQKQRQEPTVATGVQNLGHTRQGFIKCLLEVEEEEAATLRRATKALPNRKSPRTLISVPMTAPVGNSAPSLPLTLPQTPAVAPGTVPSWVQLPVPRPILAPRGAQVPASVPVTVLPAPVPDLGWRRTELSHQSGVRRMSHAKAR